jgi:hypothetical protein
MPLHQCAIPRRAAAASVLREVWDPPCSRLLLSCSSACGVGTYRNKNAIKSCRILSSVHASGSLRSCFLSSLGTLSGVPFFGVYVACSCSLDRKLRTHAALVCSATHTSLSLLSLLPTAKAQDQAQSTLRVSLHQLTIRSCCS